MQGSRYVIERRASLSCWIATVCGAPVAARLQLEFGFFIQDKLLRLVFDTAALRWCGDECSNNLEMRRIKRAHAVTGPWIIASHDKLSRAAGTSFFLYDVRRNGKVRWEPAVLRAKNASATTRG